MRKAPAVLLVDDGELDLVEEILEELGTDPTRVRGDQLSRNQSVPTQLLVTNATRAFALAGAVAKIDPSERPVWISLHNQDFLPFRERLRQAGVNFLAHCAVDRESLRLLLVHALYRGPRKRGRLRLPVGGRAEIRIDGSSSPATLTEISTNGCRLVTQHAAAPGTQIIIGLAPELATGKLLKLAGSVVRVDSEGVEAGVPRFCMAVRFESARRSSIESVIRILQGKAIGSLVTRLEPKKSASRATRSPTRATPPATRRGRSKDAEPAPQEPERKPSDRDRRRPRVSYLQTLPAVVDRLPRIVVGRDLSRHGMRIEPDPELELGTVVQVALHRGAGQDAIVVESLVTRDDGADGLVLKFVEADDAKQRELERLVEELPMFEALSMQISEPRPVVLSTLEARVARGRGKDAEVRAGKTRRDRTKTKSGKKRVRGAGR